MQNGHNQIEGGLFKLCGVVWVSHTWLAVIIGWLLHTSAKLALPAATTRWIAQRVIREALIKSIRLV